ncbi:hypothetical protein [Amycolatopsis sp. NPDC004378]
MTPTEVRWPSAADLLLAEDAEYVLLCRVLNGLRRLPTSEPPPRSTGVRMSRETTQLVEALRTGTATTDDQRQVADKLEELLDFLRVRSAAGDTGSAPTPPHPVLTDRDAA